MNRFEYTDSSGARLRLEPITERGEHLVMLSAISPEQDLVVVDIDVNRVEEVIAGLRDMARQAGGQPEPVVPPWPSRSRWHVETLDPLVNEWASGLALITRTAAVIKLDHLAKIAPTWRHDGSPVRRRIVRETTTYTVEEAGA